MKPFQYQRAPRLKPRLQELVQLFSTGHNVHQAARVMGIAPTTARGYLSDLRIFFEEPESTPEHLVDLAHKDGFLQAEPKSYKGDLK